MSIVNDEQASQQLVAKKNAHVAGKTANPASPETAFTSEPPEITAGDIKVSNRSGKLVGLIVIFVIFVLFGGWSMYAPLDSAVLSNGVVKVKSNRKTVQHLEGGIVEELRVRDGDNVKIGDVLIVLNQTQARSELEVINGKLISARAIEARLIAERDLKTTVVYPFDQLQDPRIKQLISIENQQFQARSQSLKGETQVLEQRIEQLSNQENGFRALILSKQRLVSSFEEEIQDNKALLAEGFVNKQRLRDVQRSKDQLIGEITEYRTNISGLKVKATETQLEIIQLKKHFRSEVVNQLANAQASVYDLQERASSISARLQRATILAPSNGMIIDLKIFTVGGVIGPGVQILDIVPHGEELIIESQIAISDIDNIKIGMHADIRFSSFKSGTTPVLKGSVNKLSADTLMNETTGVPFYLARLTINPEGLKKLGVLELVPGMPAEILINTGSRTLFEYLVQPATNAFARSMIEQ
jgi:epimerase transport system membrane fusion protein